MEKTCFWLCSINETVGYELNEGAVRQCRVGAGVGCARDVDAHEALTGHVQQWQLTHATEVTLGQRLGVMGEAPARQHAAVAQVWPDPTSNTRCS